MEQHDSLDSFIRKSEAEELGKKVVNTYGKFNVKVEIAETIIYREMIIFHLNLKKGTTENQLKKYAIDVQDRLKLPVFHLIKFGKLTPCIAVAEREIEYAGLLELLSNPECRKQLDKTQLPHLVGYGVTSEPTICDIVEDPHILLGGGSGSGKSVALQGMITTLAFTKSPAEVNLVLIDTGATNLRCFDGLPHLVCPVVWTRDMASKVLAALLAETERRIQLEYANQAEYNKLPRLVLFIDEFPALFLGVEKSEQRMTARQISALLQRGRHAKLHVVLAAQNPTALHMGQVDTGNLSTRIAFRCAKRNHSETILGQGGAEKLLGKGELLLTSPQYDSAVWLQGVYIAPEELHQVIQEIKSRPYHQSEYRNKFTIAESFFHTTGTDGGVGALAPIAQKSSFDEQLFAKVLLWSLSQSFISVNRLMADFQMGWSKASRLVAKLEDLGVVARLDSKLPRHVVPTELGDIPFEMMAFLQRNGISDGDVSRVLDARSTAP